MFILRTPKILFRSIEVSGDRAGTPPQFSSKDYRNVILAYFYPVLQLLLNFHAFCNITLKTCFCPAIRITRFLPQTDL